MWTQMITNSETHDIHFSFTRDFGREKVGLLSSKCGSEGETFLIMVSNDKISQLIKIFNFSLLNQYARESEQKTIFRDNIFLQN